MGFITFIYALREKCEGGSAGGFVNETQVRVWKPHRASFVFQVLSFKLGSLWCVFAKPQAQLVLVSALNPSASLHVVTHFQRKRSNWRFIVELLRWGEYNYLAFGM